MAERKPLILASASPRRRDLLAKLDIPFDVVVSPFGEPEIPPFMRTPRALAEALAYFKARAVAELHPGRDVLGADTLVACNGDVLGKPRDVSDARRMLELQACSVSEVITGVALVRLGTGGDSHCRIFSERTRVTMHDDRALREEYLASGDWAGKAGAYGIQDVGDRLIESIEGSFSNVVGLPMERVQPLLETLLLRVPA